MGEKKKSCGWVKGREEDKMGKKNGTIGEE